MCLRELQEKLDREEEIQPYEGFSKTPLHLKQTLTSNNNIKIDEGCDLPSSDDELNSVEMKSESSFSDDLIEEAKENVDFMLADASLNSSPLNEKIDKIMLNQKREIEDIMLSQIKSSYN